MELDAGKLLRPLAQDLCCPEKDTAALDDRSLRVPRPKDGPQSQPGCSAPPFSITLGSTSALTRFHFFAAALAISRTFGTSSAVMDETVCRVDEGVWGSRTSYDPEPEKGLPST